MCVQHGAQHLNNFFCSWQTLLVGDCCEKKVVFCVQGECELSKLTFRAHCLCWLIYPLSHFQKFWLSHVDGVDWLYRQYRYCSCDTAA